MRKKLNDRLFLVFFVLLFLLAVGIIQYFIWSDLFVQEFDSDVAENVLWAQASIESGKLIDPDYIYTQMQPFGGNIVFIPVVKAFGVGIFSLRLGMCICSSLFAVVLAVFSFHWDGRLPSVFSHRESFC